MNNTKDRKFESKLENQNEVNSINGVFIERVIIKKLFDCYDYDINFKNQSNVSILGLPNGWGKTTILKFIYFICKLDYLSYYDIFKVPVESVDWMFSNGVHLRYRRVENTTSNEGFNNFSYIVESVENGVAYEILDILKFVVQIMPVPEDKIDKIIMLRKYPDEITAENRHNGEVSIHQVLDNVAINIKRFVEQKLISLPCINFVTTNRIVDIANLTNLSILKNLINKIDRFNEVKERLDYNYTNGIYCVEGAARDLFEANTVFLDLITRHIAYLDYKSVSESKKKMKMKLFEKIYNELNAPDKKTLKFGKNPHLSITKNNKRLPLSSLSSGEKNLFVILYNTIFNINEDNIILIDEPEISLHMEWQEKLVDYLIEICKVNNIQVIITTHSPYIVNGHLNLVVQKDGENGED